MIQESYVSFEQAKELKELGFPQLQELKWYSTYLCNPGEAIVQDVDLKFPEVCAPTQTLVQKWLREEKGLHIIITFSMDDGNYYKKYTKENILWQSHIESYYPKIKDIESCTKNTSYKEALSASIDKCIDVLKKKK